MKLIILLLLIPCCCCSQEYKYSGQRDTLPLMLHVSYRGKSVWESGYMISEVHTYSGVRRHKTTYVPLYKRSYYLNSNFEYYPHYYEVKPLGQALSFPKRWEKLQTKIL